MKCDFLAVGLKGASWKSLYLMFLKTGRLGAGSGNRASSRSQWGWEGRPGGVAPCTGWVGPSCSPRLQPPAWAGMLADSRGGVWLHSLQGPHADPSSVLPHSKAAGTCTSMSFSKIFGCAWCSLLCEQAFSSCNEWELLSSCGACASHFGGFSCCRAQALGHTGFSSCATWT